MHAAMSAVRRSRLSHGGLQKRKHKRNASGDRCIPDAPQQQHEWSPAARSPEWVTPRYSEEHGGHRTVLERHRNLNLSSEQKDRWVELMLETAPEVLPNDAELQARFADYIVGARGLL
jgi:hypothetical protein